MKDRWGIDQYIAWMPAYYGSDKATTAVLAEVRKWLDSKHILDFWLLKELTIEHCQFCPNVAALVPVLREYREKEEKSPRFLAETCPVCKCSRIEAQVYKCDNCDFDMEFKNDESMISRWRAITGINASRKDIEDHMEWKKTIHEKMNMLREAKGFRKGD